MGPRLVHYSDVENAFDRPERVGRLAGTIEQVRAGDESDGGESGGGSDEALVVGTGDDTAPGALALERRGRQALAFFERVEPDAETFGNHDFDFSLADTRAVVSESAVPWVSANVRHDGEPFAGVDPARVVERGGERVALVGVSDPDIALPRGIEVGDPVGSVRETWETLSGGGNSRPPDYLVVLAHTTDATARALAGATPADAVLAGHVHGEARAHVDGTLLVRPGANGRVVWEVDLGDGGVTSDDATATATRHEVPEGPLDEETAAVLRAEMEETGLTEVVATVDKPVARDRAACLRGECALANLATDALRWVADADVAHVDARGLRDGPPIGPDVTVADLVGVAPFEAGIHVATVSTRDLLALVGESVQPAGVDSEARSASEQSSDGEVWTGQFAGIALRRDREAGETRVLASEGTGAVPGARRLGTVADDGTRRVAERREFRLATNGYVVYTDEFETVGPADARELHGLQYEAFVAYARGADLDPGVDGRIRVVGE